MIYKILTLGLLAVCSVMDLKMRKVYTFFCVAVAIMGLGFHAVLRDGEIQELLPGIAIGLALLIISLLSDESIGRGDAFVIIALGCSLSGMQVFQITFLAFVMTTVFAIIGAMIKKIKLKSEVPFIPFLLVSEIMILVLERVKI